MPDGEPGTAATVGAACGALAFAFSATLWEHAVKFTPYILTAVFTGLILLTMVRWWEVADRAGAWRWIALLTLLFGIDFSVHRTNALLMPGAIAWILIRHPRTMRQPRAWLAAFAGMAAGLSLQLAVMPLAAHTQSPLNMFDPSTWSRFWDYVSLANAGGGFLVDLWPRKADLWSVQTADFLRVLATSFLYRGTPVRILGWLPALVALAGLFVLVRRHPRLGAALAVVMLLHAGLTVLYFNIPANFFRSFDRHYLPVFVTVGVAVAYGASALAQNVARLVTHRWWSGAAVGAAALIVPGAQLAANWSTHDASDRWFTRDYAANALGALPPNAIYFTVGDNDSFPVWYLQSVEGVRPDVRIVNLGMTNADWYVDQLRRDPSFPLTLTGSALRDYRARWSDSLFVVPVQGSPEGLGLPSRTMAPESISMQPKPMSGTEVVPSDVVLLDLLRTNRWRTPLTFAITIGSGLGWLRPFAQLEGLHWRILPLPNPPPDPEALRDNLIERYEYRGYADPSVEIEDVTRTIGLQYLAGFEALMRHDAGQESRDRCRATRAHLFSSLPPARLQWPSGEAAKLESVCP